MKAAIVHDYLVQMGGAEKVVEVLRDMFPSAPVYTSLYDPSAMPESYRSWDIRTSFLQKLPSKRKAHRLALPLYPMAFESFDLSGYDLVISSSSAFAKGVITSPDTLHICYTHAPMRFAWDTGKYLENENVPRPLGGALALVNHYLRAWDSVASARVDQFVANSSVVARRIRKYYRSDSEIIYPPVETKRFALSRQPGSYYLIAARAAPYKRLDLAVSAFSRMGKPLKMVGGGRQMEALKAGAGPSVEFLGRVGDAELVELMANARAYVMPGAEDFGIAPVEANACGRPVIAYAAGGALDTQIDGVTGVLFDQQTVESLCAAVLRLEELDLDPGAIRESALRFDTSVFRRRLGDLITLRMAAGSGAGALPPQHAALASVSA